MEANREIAAFQDPIQEMYDFFAFDEALENGFSATALIEQEQAQSRSHLEERVQQLILQLQNLMEAQGEEQEGLVQTARTLAPQDAQRYCDTLSQRLQNLQQIVSRQEQGFDLAQQAISGQTKQNNQLLASLVKMRALCKRQQETSSRLQRSLCDAGTALCNYTHRNQRNAG